MIEMDTKIDTERKEITIVSLSLCVGETRCGLILFTMIFILRTHAQMFPENVGTFHFDCHCRRSKAENQELC